LEAIRFFCSTTGLNSEWSPFSAGNSVRRGKKEGNPYTYLVSRQSRQADSSQKSKSKARAHASGYRRKISVA
jgi:hypothetical protein